MTRRRLLTSFVLVVLILTALGSRLARAEQRGDLPAGGLLEPFESQRLRGEVMSVDRQRRLLVVRVIEDAKRVRDMSLALDDRTVLKKLPTPISGGDLTPGHLVTVTYGDHAGGLLAHRIEVTGKAVHQPMP